MNNQLPTVLIVEDDENDFLFLERALAIEKFGAHVQRACDGVEAIEYLAGENDFADRANHPLPQLIVLDLKMPRRNGFEVLAWMRQRPKLGALPVVVFSSSEEPGDVEKAYNLGASGYLVKPSSYLAYSEIVRTLGEFLVNGCEQKPGQRKARTAPRAMNSRQVV
jgi:CheY-like chemotaxis protein